MSTTSRLAYTHVALIIAAIGLAVVGLVHAENCDTQQCIEVGVNKVGGFNTICWLDMYNLMNKQFRGEAYSTTFAGTGYGTVPQAGAPNPTQVNGWYVPVIGNSDCPTNITPVSGTETMYITKNTINDSFPNNCVTMP